MKNYLTVVILMNILVHWLLLVGANKLAGHPLHGSKCMIGALIGGIYSRFCLLPDFSFLGGFIWRCICLGLMGMISYGVDVSGIKRSALFMLVSIAYSAVAAAAVGENLWSAMGGGVLFCVIGYFGLRTLATRQQYVEVELERDGKQEKLLALCDTGNTLRDPVSGQSVLVADAKSAEALLGLSREQLRCPVETVASAVVRGLRLIPYRTVGQSGGMLVAIRLDHVRIGSWQGSAVVAFAPEGLGEGNTYRALAGGMV